MGWIPGQGTKIHNASSHSQNKTDQKRGQSETETLKQIITIKIIFKKKLSSLLYFHINFRISLSINEKKSSWSFYRHCIEFIDKFEECCHLNNLQSSPSFFRIFIEYKFELMPNILFWFLISA